MKKTMRKVLNRHKLVAGFYIMVLWAIFFFLLALLCGAVEGTLPLVKAGAIAALVVICTNTVTGAYLRENEFIERTELLIAEIEEGNADSE